MRRYRFGRYTLDTGCRELRTEMTRFDEEKGIEADWTAFAMAWRGLYQPTMQRGCSGEPGWARPDTLHRMNLSEVGFAAERHAGYKHERDA